MATTLRSFTRITADGHCEMIDRELADEVPIALEFNGIGYAVMMATPADLSRQMARSDSFERISEDTMLSTS